jgi:hypothetical protein
VSGEIEVGGWRKQEEQNGGETGAKYNIHNNYRATMFG